MAKKQATDVEFIGCVVKQLPEESYLLAAASAISENPSNAPSLMGLGILDELPTPARIAILTEKYWGSGGVNLGVYFMDTTNKDLMNRILSHMNAWGKTANVKFQSASSGMAQVRIARQQGDGYWSYLGTDILHIPPNEPTMNLDSFTMSTPESEYLRVVRHETGHTLGCPHEHLRKEIINRLDVNKTITYFRQQYGWSESATRSNVLTPVKDSEIIATPKADEVSIMAYQLPGSITKDGRPIVGGTDINDLDASFMSQRYPLATPPPPKPTGTYTITIKTTGDKPEVTIEQSN